jgi:hypothetical protein
LATEEEVVSSLKEQMRFASNARAREEERCSLEEARYLREKEDRERALLLTEEIGRLVSFFYIPYFERFSNELF